MAPAVAPLTVKSMSEISTLPTSPFLPTLKIKNKKAEHLVKWWGGRGMAGEGKMIIIEIEKKKKPTGP